MGIFKTISDMIGSVVRGKDKVKGIDKNDILNLIDNNLISLNTVVNTYKDNPDIFSYIQKTLLPANGSNRDNVYLRQLYDSYYLELNPSARSAETTMILKSLNDAAVLAIADHTKIRDNFTTLFNQGTDVSEIHLEQLKLSHAAIFGYINLSALLADWFIFFYTSVVGHAGEALRVPAYREQVIKTSSALVASFVSDVISRGSSKSILDVVSGIRSKGDVLLYSDAASLDTYANINDYPGAMKLFDSRAGFQPILWVREWFSLYAHDKYKRNITLRDWMITKTAVLRMDMQSVDTNSPEYQRQLSILNKYSDEIAKLDKKIAAYENS